MALPRRALRAVADLIEAADHGAGAVRDMHPVHQIEREGSLPRDFMHPVHQAEREGPLPRDSMHHMHL